MKELNINYQPIDAIKGNIRSIAFLEHSYLDKTAGAIFQSSNGFITALEPAQGKKFFKYELKLPNTDFAKEEMVINAQGKSEWQQEVFIQLTHWKLALRNEIRLLAVQNLAIIIEDAMGNYWLFGEAEGMKVSRESPPEGSSKINELLFKAIEQKPALRVSTALASKIII